MDHATEVVASLRPNRKKRRVRIVDIQEAVVAHFGLTRDDLLSRNRKRAVARPRQIGMFLAHHLTKNTLPEIARRFGLHNHTTALHGIHLVQELLQTDAQVALAIVTLRQQLG